MRLVVVGGVGGGMSAAARARRLDEEAEIIVLERGPEVSFANCGLPYFVSGEITDPEALLVQTPEKLRESLGLDVRVNSEVVEFLPDGKTVVVENGGRRYGLTYDQLILSPGAVAARPPIPGLDSPRVHTLRTVSDAVTLDELTETSRTAVVLGAGFIGLEAAEALRMRGLEVTVVELADHVLPPLEVEMASLVDDELRRMGIDVRTGVAAARVERGEERDVVVLGDGSRVGAEIIVLSVGVRPDTAVWEAAGIQCKRGAIVIDEFGRTSIPGVWAVGDATVSTNQVTGEQRPVALAGPANRAGRLVSDAVMGRSAHRLPELLGTAIVRVGEQTAALTGANRAALMAAGIPHHTLHLHPLDHAGYFPGANQMHLIIHFGHDGKLLGAQGVGRSGVDKRIDVLAVAIKAGMSAAGLVDLDLAYSPPYGAAKDPVNMAGMAAANVLDGTVSLWHAADLERVMSEALVVDVRTDAEVATGMIRGALHIPHTELRDRMGEVRAVALGRPVRVHCQSGVRSYLAHRQLVQAGFDSAHLSGGMLTLRAAWGSGLDKHLVVA